MTTAIHAQPASVATSRLRMTAYCLLLSAAAFIQEPGRIVADTKWDLAEDPIGFMGRALHLWDPLGAFGQVQNQAYGYFWPMGPFFALGDVIGLPVWVTQRLWWALILCVAFVGVVKLCKVMGVGRPWAQVLGGFAFALSVHTLTLLGPTSIEAWPSAVAPWVLIPLVLGAQRGSARRAGCLAGLAVLMCGGVNAVATATVLPLGVLWIATRSSGSRRRGLFGWWLGSTALATMWWWLPLLILGKYSPPFLDYIENAPITTRSTGLGDVLGGSSDWVAYVSLTDWRAGNLLGTTPFLLLDAAALAGLGIAGICRSDNPHARFLFSGLLVGLAIVTFGYTGVLHGWYATDRQELLDGALAPLRNLHKFDVVIRIPLVLGMVHFVSVFRVGSGQGRRVMAASVSAMAVVAVAGVASPAYLGRIAPAGSFTQIPEYWREAAGYLNQNAAESGRILVLPAASFGNYDWGSTHDEVVQPLLDIPWAVRNVVPLAQPGNVRFLDTVTRRVEAGDPDDGLAALLARNGVSTLVVRNDLDPFGTGAPDPVVLHQALDRSDGITKVAEFGPTIGSTGESTADSGAAVFTNRGRAAEYPAVEVYSVDGASTVTAWETATVPVVYGDPSTDPAVGGIGLESVPTVLEGDAGEDFDDSPRVLTDGMARREVAFAHVRDNESATLMRGQEFATRSVEPYYRLFNDDSAYQTVESWAGVDSVTASSAQSNANAVGTIDPANSSSAAADADPATYWQSTGFHGAVGQWWQMNFSEPTEVRRVRVTMGSAVGPAVTRLSLVTDQGRESVDAPAPHTSATYELPAALSSRLRVVVDDVRGSTDGVQVRIADVQVPGVSPVRVLQTPKAKGPVDVVALQRARARGACALVAQTFRCDDIWVRNVEGGDVLAREVRLDTPGAFSAELVASLRPSSAASAYIASKLPVSARATSSLSRDLRGSAVAAVDNQPATTWIAAVGDARPRLDVGWATPVRIDRIDLALSSGVAAATPESVLLVSGKERRTVSLDSAGVGRFKPVTTRRVSITIVAASEALSLEGSSVVPMPVGVSELSFPGSDVQLVDPGARVDLGCGSGPSLGVKGDSTQSRVDVSLEELTSRPRFLVNLCSDSQVDLEGADNLVISGPSAITRPEELTLTNTGRPPLAVSPVAVQARQWRSDQRYVAVEARGSAALLVVNENFNEGWRASADGRSLDPQRVDGWKQGWLLPAGAATSVELTFAPDRTYRLGLAAGLCGVAVVLVLAFWRRGSTEFPSLGAAASMPVFDAIAVVVLISVIGGWPGLVMSVAALGVRWLWIRPTTELGAVAGLLVLLAGLLQALDRSQINVSTIWPAQLLIVASLAIGACAVVANRPTFLRRKHGRSST